MLQSFFSGYEPPYIIPNLTIYHSVIHLTSVNGLRVGAARAEDVQGTPTQSHVSQCILIYDDYSKGWLIPVVKRHPRGFYLWLFFTLEDVH